MNYCTFPQRPPWGQEESGRGESRGKIGKIGKKERKGIATLTSSTVSLTVRESKELLMLLYRYDVDWNKKPCYKGINGIVFDVGMLLSQQAPDLIIT